MKLKKWLPFLFLSILSISQVASCSATKFPLEDTLIKSNEVHPIFFPEILYITNFAGDRCTATIVGDRALMTAAHCVQRSNIIQPVHGPRMTGICQAHPEYNATDGADYDVALCLMNRQLNPPYATIASQGPKVNERILLTGYGCIAPDKSGGNDGILRIGYSKVNALPHDDYRAFTTYDDAALCSGDSGGPALKVKGDLTESAHIVLGVNARGNMQKLSILTAVFDPDIQIFLRFWSESHHASICGITLDCDSQYPMIRAVKPPLEEKFR